MRILRVALCARIPLVGGRKAAAAGTRMEDVRKSRRFMCSLWHESIRLPPRITKHLIKLGLAASLIVAVSLLIRFVMRPDDTAGPCVRVLGPVMLPEIPESSGLAVSRRDPRLLWSHNDSGHDTVLFALDANGSVRARVRVPIRTADWEDISAAACPSTDCLYIADIGDNGLRRQRVQIYRVREPAPGDAQTEAPEIFTATYVDGAH